MQARIEQIGRCVHERSVSLARSVTHAFMSSLWDGVVRGRDASTWTLPGLLGGWLPDIEAPGSARSYASMFGSECAARIRRDIKYVTTASYAAGQLYTRLLPVDYRKKKGAYYTPPVLAARLLDLVDRQGMNWKTARILDPACGGGAFLVPVLLRVKQAFALSNGKNDAMLFERIEEQISGIEIDPFSAWLTQVLSEIALLDTTEGSSRRLRQLVHVADGLSSEVVEHYGAGSFDLVVGNPPYGRISLGEAQRIRFSRSLYGHANLYALFTDQALRLVKPDGLIAYITPTSFLGGQYFKNLRRTLAEKAPPVSMDLVHERSGVFSDVLQETLLALYKSNSPRKPLFISVVSNLASSAGVQIRENTGTLSIGRDPSLPWVFPRQVEDRNLVEALFASPYRLADYGFRISTGPLVWNRHKDQFRNEPKRGRYPVIWSESIRLDGSFEFRAEKKNHAPYFEIRSGDEWLLSRRPCILIQRTTAKEQNRRIIAAVLPVSFLDTHGAAVIENHVNVLYPVIDSGSDLRLFESETYSLEAMLALLRSRLMDVLVRCINGSVALSAYELESMPFPPPHIVREVEALVKVGRTQSEIDSFLEETFANAQPTTAD